MSKVIERAYAAEKEKAFDYRRAMEEAARCLLCEDAPCSKGCPAGTDPGKFIRSLRFKNVKGAAETIRENNPLGGSCAMVCPYDRMCEEACSRCGIDKPIQIGAIQRYLVEMEARDAMRFVKAGKPTGKRVACVGAGPASLACARELARRGVAVTIFEAREKAGGVLSYGITPTRLPQEMIDHDIQLIKDLGVIFEFNTPVDFAKLDELRQTYDAVFVGVGLWAAKKPSLPGDDLEGVETALDFLARARTCPDAMDLPDHVVVIGGGNVAMDCATTAKQLGAEKTAIVYRRSVAEAPADMDEIRFVQNMGVPIHTEFAPEAILGEGGKVAGLACRSRDGYSEMKIKADRIVFAIGQKQTDDYAHLAAAGNLYIGGDDAHDQGATVVEAVAEGKAAAEAMLSRMGLV